MNTIRKIKSVIGFNIHNNVYKYKYKIDKYNKKNIYTLIEMYLKVIHLLLIVLINELIEKVDTFYMNLGHIIKRLNMSRLQSIIIPNDIHNDNKRKLISISPGGFKGVYMYGTCIYIKENYDTSDFIFSGASAGAWNSLMMTCKKDIKYFKEILLEIIKETKSIKELEIKMKEKILETYETVDFDLSRLYIGVTSFRNFRINTVLFHDFKSLEDALDACIASSHIPFISGGLLNKYKSIYTFDGGISSYPYIETEQKLLHITPDIWIKRNNSSNRDLQEITSLFSKNKYNFEKLFQEGYEDAQTNKEYLDSIFLGEP
jgi:hypothetical protein